MKVSFINPNLSGDVSILDMGVTTLATYLNERTDHQAEIIDFTFRRHTWRDVLRAKIEAFRPDVIGITATSLYLGYIRRIARAVKREFGLPIVLGGYHPSLCPEECIAEPWCDALCIGDGEYAFTELLDAWRDGASVEGVAGVWAKVDGQVIQNPPRPLVQNLDDLPIQNYDLWDDLDKYLYYMELLYFIGTRGCPFNCTYCSSLPMKEAIPGRHYRPRDPRAFAQEIRVQWEKYGSRGMRIAHTFDPVFTFSRKWLEAFADEYIRCGMASRLPYSCFTRADTIDEDKVRMLKDSNCKVIRLGVEAGCERIRNDIYKKNISNEQIRRAVSLCKEAGLTITAYNMLGGPTETRATLMETFRLNQELDVHRPVFFIYRPLPKTKSREQLERGAGAIDADRFNQIDSLHFRGCVRTGDLSPNDVERFQARCFLYFISRRVFRLIRQQKHRFFINLVRYMWRAYRDGVEFQYAVAYFLICCRDNLTS